MSENLQYPIIAGKAAGKRIRCKPSLQPTYTRLEQAALRGNHWARFAVKELNALTTGLADKSNVYTRPGDKDQYGNTRLAVFLPGLKATVMRFPQDEYCITELVLDGNFFGAVAGHREQTRLGLYRVTSRGTGGWLSKYVEDGNVASENGRVVTVVDSGYRTANDAAEGVVPRVLKYLGASAAGVRKGGCDLHFTPGRKRLGGLVRYNALAENSSRASAVQLSNTMTQARQLKGIIWIVDQGGSAVYTQAMQILVDRGVTLNEHTVYLNKPRTSPGNALRLAKQLKLTLNESFADTGWDPVGALSQLSVAGARLKDEVDPYNKTYHAHAWLNALVKMAGPVGAGTAGAMALGATATSIAMVGGIVTAIGGAGAVYSLGQGVAEDLRHKLKR